MDLSPTFELAQFMAELSEQQLAFFETYADEPDVTALAKAIRAIKPMYAPPPTPKRGRPRKVATNGSGS